MQVTAEAVSSEQQEQGRGAARRPDLLLGSPELRHAVAALSWSHSLQPSVLAPRHAQTGQKLDYLYLLQSLMMNNPQGAVALAKMAVKQVRPSLSQSRAIVTRPSTPCRRLLPWTSTRSQTFSCR